jgi:hypothetical protein
MRQSGEPYYSHPIEVAIMLADFTALEAPKLYKSYMINVALLHDTIEDTILTHADISKIFDKNIADNVERLTRIKPYGKISSGEMLNLLIHSIKYDCVHYMLLLIPFHKMKYDIKEIINKSNLIDNFIDIHINKYKKNSLLELLIEITTYFTKN